jgi:hypothetical protein
VRLPFALICHACDDLGTELGIQWAAPTDRVSERRREYEAAELRRLVLQLTPSVPDAKEIAT